MAFDIDIGYAPSGTSYSIMTLVRQAFESAHEVTGVKQIVFDDKTIDADEIRKRSLQGTSGNDTNLRGYSTNDTINGLDGNDSLYGNGLGNSLGGGNGNDYLTDQPAIASGMIRYLENRDVLTGGEGDDLLHTRGGKSIARAIGNYESWPVRDSVIGIKLLATLSDEEIINRIGIHDYHLLQQDILCHKPCDVDRVFG